MGKRTKLQGYVANAIGTLWLVVTGFRALLDVSTTLGDTRSLPQNLKPYVEFGKALYLPITAALIFSFLIVINWPALKACALWIGGCIPRRVHATKVSIDDELPKASKKPSSPSVATAQAENDAVHFLISSTDEHKAQRIAKAVGCHPSIFHSAANQRQHISKLRLTGTDAQLESCRNSLFQEGIAFISTCPDWEDSYFSEHHPPPQKGMMWSNQNQEYFWPKDPARIRAEYESVIGIREDISRFKTQDLDGKTGSTVSKVLVTRTISGWHDRLCDVERRLKEWLQRSKPNPY